MAFSRHQIARLLTRRYPFLSGCATFANSRTVRILAGNATGLVWSRLESGPEILTPLDDYVGKAAYFVGDLDRKVSALCRRIVRPGDRVMDVGANLGVVSLLLANLVGPGGEVHAFEPNPAVHALFRKSIDRNGFRQVRTYACALGSRNGESLDLTFPASNAGQGTLGQSRVGEGWKRVTVPVRSLDSLAAEVELDRVRLMKIDVEGFEAEVLQGARDWLTRTPPTAILFESNEAGEAGRPDVVPALLEGYGYTLYTLPKRYFRMRLVPYRSAGRPAESSHDMLAVRTSVEQEIVSGLSDRA